MDRLPQIGRAAGHQADRIDQLRLLDRSPALLALVAECLVAPAVGADTPNEAIRKKLVGLGIEKLPASPLCEKALVVDFQKEFLAEFFVYRHVVGLVRAAVDVEFDSEPGEISRLGPVEMGR